MKSTATKKAGRYGPRYQALRLEAFARDDNRCCACYEDRELQAHHRVPDGHPALKDDTYLKLSHLYTFCQSCHDVWTDKIRRTRYTGAEVSIQETKSHPVTRPVVALRDSDVHIQETKSHPVTRPVVAPRSGDTVQVLPSTKTRGNNR